MARTVRKVCLSVTSRLPFMPSVTSSDYTRVFLSFKEYSPNFKQTLCACGIGFRYSLARPLAACLS